MATHAVHHAPFTPRHMLEESLAHAWHRIQEAFARTARTWEPPRRAPRDVEPPRQRVDATTIRQRASYEAGGMRSFTTF